MRDAAPAPRGADRLEWLRAAAADGSVEEVVVAVPDLGGRLLGQRLDAGYFLSRVAADGLGACVYLLAVDVDMTTDRHTPGYAIDATAPRLRRPRPAPRPRHAAPHAVGPGDRAGRRGRRHAGRRRDPGRAARRPAPAAGAAAAPGADRPGRRRARVPAVRRHVRRGARPRLPRPHAGVALQRRLRARPAWRASSPSSAGSGARCAPPGCGMESARGEVHPGQYEIVFRYADALRHLRPGRRSTRPAPGRSRPPRAPR